MPCSPLCGAQLCSGGDALWPLTDFDKLFSESYKKTVKKLHKFQICTSTSNVCSSQHIWSLCNLCGLQGNSLIRTYREINLGGKSILALYREIPVDNTC